MIIDATDRIVGRIATVAAKAALLGEDVQIVNCEKAVMTGKKPAVHAEMKRRRDMGTFKGPYLPRMPDRFVRRIVRGMLPYKQEKGKKAFGRVMCHIGIPHDLKNKETTSIDGAHVSKTGSLHYVTIGEICAKLGGKS